MSKLSEKEHWDYVHTAEEQVLLHSDKASIRRNAAKALKTLLGQKVFERMSNYDEHLRWNVIFPRYLADLRGAKVLEIGSAPGEYIVEFSHKYGCIPYGIEYSDVGAELNRKVFARNGFDPANVIYGDFFSDEFHQKYKEQFDVVISRGFIEHFTDVKSVIDRHMSVLAPRGYLIVSVPNLRGINYTFADVFNNEVIPLHNIEIMKKPVFADLFVRKDLERLFCDHYGTFSFYLFTAGKSTIMRRTLKAAYKVQPVLNLAFRTLFGNKGAESRFLSPYLLCIGRKVDTQNGH
jgi:2-polyprenyl-3-methyl-5-hydroxy-6-metoxy-1,4-benzoquinol methylase